MKICVFGASGSELDQKYFDDAHAFGALLAAGGHTLVFGGGSRGLMGACARGAAELGGAIVGIAPRFFDEPGILFGGCTRFVFTETMRERKAAMEDESDAFLVMPGGIGTLEEFFEMLTLKQLGRHTKPMAILNTLGYYDELLRMLEKAADSGFMSRQCLRLFHLCTSPAQALEQLLHDRPISGGSRRLIQYTEN